ncbi:MAG: sigma-70 family RNA polymerase sigma factor [Clostridia bacterium]|nr:sigma-70 family RNA polymerase sigma factor [Clostridia bacterium]
MAVNKVELCGMDTSSLPVIKNERMRELFPRVHAGDQTARNEFVQGNLRLVLSVIKRFQGRGESVDDLFQVGCIGLMKAIDNFDVSQNVRFSTYAVPMKAGCRNQIPRRRFIKRTFLDIFGRACYADSRL